ncbi:MAG: dihydrodipicolinate synthase family protein [Xanthobacteraceae bacterium]
MLDIDASGVYVIAVTPFTANGAIDGKSVDRMVDFYLGCGVTGITVLGIMGEAPKLTHAEAVAVARQVVGRANVPVVVGVSAPGFAAMAELSKAVMDFGAAGVMIAPPSTLKTDDQIVDYYGNATEAIGRDVPFVIQDYPLANGVVFAPSVVRRIVASNPSCVMLKHEDWPGLDKITALRKFTADGDMRRISILCGNGGLFLPQEVERGADGAMTGYAFPEMLVALVRSIKAGERAAAHDLFDRHLPLLRYEHQPGVGLAVRKYVLKRRGVIASDGQRKPAGRLSPESIAEIEWMLDRLAKKGVSLAGFSQNGRAASER